MFEAMVEGFVRDAIRDWHPDCFDELVIRLPGVYPTDALSAVDRLAQREELDPVIVARLRRRSPIAQTSSAPTNQLPVPHPLDFDWRFTGSAVERLTRECLARSK